MNDIKSIKIIIEILNNEKILIECNQFTHCLTSDCNKIDYSAQKQQFSVYLNVIIIFSPIIDFPPNTLIEPHQIHSTPY